MSASSSAVDVQTWIADDGELGALRSLLREHRIPYSDVSDEPPSEVDLLVSNPRRALDVERSRNRIAPRMHIVMASGLSRTLRQRLQRSACDFIVDESVHPGALRLLLEYALYRGPERRESTRVPMGAPVKLKVGWRQRKGTLVQLSERGCGIMLDGAISADDVSVRLPAWGGQRIDVPLRVLDQREVKGIGHVVSFLFRRMDMATRRSIRIAMKQAATDVGRLEPGRHDAVAEQARRKKKVAANTNAAKKNVLRRTAAAAKAPMTPAHKKPKPPPLALPGRQSTEKTNATDLPSDDRRQNLRAHYMRRVIATREGHAHVVIGQDISVGGMRIGKEPGILVGDDLKLALYGVGSEERVIVSARVVRDDGLAGLGVKFENVTSEAQERLTKLVDAIPILGRSKNAEASRPSVVVSEVLEHEGHDDSD